MSLGHLGPTRGHFTVHHCPQVLIDVNEDVVEVWAWVEALISSMVATVTGSVL